MDCCIRAITAKLCAADVGPYCAFPACDALIVQVPIASRVATLPETVQTDGVVDAKLTGKPEEAVAARLTDPVVSVVVGIALKLMVCAS